MVQNDFNIDYNGSLVLENTLIDGNIKTDKDIYLRGVIIGSVHCEVLILEENAKIEGDIFCKELYTAGLVIGNVEVSGRTQLRKQAVIKGYLSTSSLLLHPEAVIEKGLKLQTK